VAFVHYQVVAKNLLTDLPAMIQLSALTLVKISTGAFAVAPLAMCWTSGRPTEQFLFTKPPLN
jgi:hypothetical protein